MPKAQEKYIGLLDSWGRRNNRKLPDKICPQCGRLFKPRKDASIYCSHECLWKNNGKNQGQEQDHEVWRLSSRGYIQGCVWRNGICRQVKQHRWLMEQYLNRRLTRQEVVHHINGDKTDNRLENLRLLQYGAHSSLHNYGKARTKGQKLNLSLEERKRRGDRINQARIKWLQGGENGK